jgi:serine protease
VALAFLTTPLAAQAAPAPSRAPLSAVEGEVIVRFKADAQILRQHALAARASASMVSDVLESRARIMASRSGRSLSSGAAVGDRTQVLRATGVDAATLARELAADPDVEFAEPNGRQRRLTAPNDPLYAAQPMGLRSRGPDAGQWYLRAPQAPVVSSIDIETAWARTTGSPSVVVAVLDTGVRFEHPDLGRVAAGGKLLPGYDFVTNVTVANDGSGRDSDPSDPGDWVTTSETTTSTFRDCLAADSSWHGTATASLVGASTNDAVGMAGTAPGVRVLPVRVLGKCYGVDSDIQAGMRWAAGIPVAGVPDNPNPAKVLNMSLGGSSACSASYQAAVDEILARGVVIVAAAGNSAGGPVGTPASCNGVIAVAALRHVGTKVGFSDLGPQITIAAPGGNCINIGDSDACVYPILSAVDSGSQGPAGPTWTDSFNITVGTSFSSPLVAGTVGLMFSAQPALTPAQVRSALQATARPFPTTGADNGGDPTPVPQCRAPSSSVEQLQCYCTTGLCGAGMLDAGAAVSVVATLAARISVDTATPTAGSPVVLSSGSSSTGPGRQLTAWSWAIVNGGGIASVFNGVTNGASASLTPSGAGSFTVRLIVTDDLGLTASSEQVVTVAAAPVSPTPVTPSPTPVSGGGGAMSWPWLMLLILAVAALGFRKPGRA